MESADHVSREEGKELVFEENEDQASRGVKGEPMAEYHLTVDPRAGEREWNLKS